MNTNTTTTETKTDQTFMWLGVWRYLDGTVRRTKQSQQPAKVMEERPEELRLLIFDAELLEHYDGFDPMLPGIDEQMNIKPVRTWRLLRGLYV